MVIGVEVWDVVCATFGLRPVLGLAERTPAAIAAVAAAAGVVVGRVVVLIAALVAVIAGLELDRPGQTGDREADSEQEGGAMSFLFSSVIASCILDIGFKGKERAGPDRKNPARLILDAGAVGAIQVRLSGQSGGL